MVFLSTLSLRRATHPEPTKQTQRLNFYPRSPCGERPCRRGIVFDGPGISIHALLAESDVACCIICDRPDKFLSTLSLRRATGNGLILKPISSHFYPRSPCGERPLTEYGLKWLAEFLSTLSLRRATRQAGQQQQHHNEFLSTLSLRRATMALALCFYLCWYFYPRSPCGERQEKFS